MTIPLRAPSCATGLLPPRLPVRLDAVQHASHTKGEQLDTVSASMCMRRHGLANGHTTAVFKAAYMDAGPKPSNIRACFVAAAVHFQKLHPITALVAMSSMLHVARMVHRCPLVRERHAAEERAGSGVMCVMSAWCWAIQ
jgi:hypothetical protein